MTSSNFARGEMRSISSQRRHAAALTVLCVLLLAAASAYFFRGVFDPSNTIDGLDSSLWVPMSVQQWTEWLFVPRWGAHYFAGLAQQIYFLSHGLPLILTVPPHNFHGIQFMLDSFLAGAFMFAFLRSRNLGRFGALVGALAFQLGNNLLTTASLGGMWKFATACWVPLFLLFFIRVIEGAPNRLRNSVFAGAALGLQLLGGEVQLSYYVGLFAAAYFVFDSIGRLWSAHNGGPLSGPLKDAGRRTAWAALCAAFALVFAAEVLCNYGSFTQVSENVGGGGADDNWRFVTEFSFPPSETVALALTGRVSGSDTYSLEYQGVPVPRMSDDYLGIVVLMFAFLALFSGNRKAWFFAGAAMAALVISYGRFFPPPFKLIYALPVMKGLRNPHKWLFITALCVPILAGIGADFWHNARSSKNRRIQFGVLLFFAFSAALLFVSPLVTDNPLRTVPVSVYARIALLAAASGACLIALTKKVRHAKHLRMILPLLILALIAGDLIQNASRFIKYYDYRERFIDDDLVKWLTSRPEPFRVKLWSESPYLRHLITEVMPYHGIGTPDVVASRRPAKYSRVFEALRDGRLSFEKYFQLFNVRYIISSSPITGAGMPLSLAATFGDASSRTAYVYEPGSFLSRAFVVNEFEVAPADDILGLIGGSDFDLHRTVALEKRPDLASGEGSPEWSVEGFSHMPHEVGMRVFTDRPGLLVLHDMNDPKWRARIDGEEVEIFKANFLMRAVAVPEGEHAVVFTYDPPVWGFVVTLISWAVVLLLAASVAVVRLGRARAACSRRAESGAS